MRADGYLNATAMWRACDKEWSGYVRTADAKAFIDELSTSLLIGRDALVIICASRPLIEI